MSSGRILIYTPTYEHSKGLQYRLNMLMKSLWENEYTVFLYKDERETLLRKLYGRFARYALQYRSVWECIGESIAKKILKLNRKVDIVFLTTDVCVAAAKDLRKAGLKVVLLLEDLTVDWLNISGKSRDKVLKNLVSFAAECEIIVTPSYEFSERVRKELNLETLPIPPGVELAVTKEDVINRCNQTAKPLLLHARQIITIDEARIISLVCKELKGYAMIYALRAGSYVSKVPSYNVTWYHYDSIKEAINNLKKCHIGVIATTRDAPTFTSQWFYFSMLQPVIAITRKPIDDAYWLLLFDFINNPELLKEKLRDIMENYQSVIRKLEQNIKLKHLRNIAHKRLIEELNKIVTS